MQNAIEKIFTTKYQPKAKNHDDFDLLNEKSDNWEGNFRLQDSDTESISSRRRRQVASSGF